MTNSRTRLMAGNWKMNKLNSELSPFFAELAQGTGRVTGCEVLFAVPYTLLAHAVEAARPHGIRIAAQNCHAQASGAFTGEISIGMLKEIGVFSTLIGHSERRQYFGETDESVAKKTDACLKQGLMPIVCVGETLKEREAGQTEKVVARQIHAVMSETSAAHHLVIAYEPVWAIGTGKSATTAEAQDVHRFIRGLVAERFGDKTAGSLRILYGGSANPANVVELLAQPDIDGALVGGASLKPADFSHMVKASAAPRH